MVRWIKCSWCWLSCIEPWTSLFPEDQLLVLDHVMPGCCACRAGSSLHVQPAQTFNPSVNELQISLNRKAEKVWLTVQRLKASADWMKYCKLHRLQITLFPFSVFLFIYFFLKHFLAFYLSKCWYRPYISHTAHITLRLLLLDNLFIIFDDFVCFWVNEIVTLNVQWHHYCVIVLHVLVYLVCMLHMMF